MTLARDSDTVNVLIAEDDPDDQYLFESALRDSGASAEIRFVLTGQHLIEFLLRGALSGSPQKDLPDIIIADLKKPFFWFEVIRELRIYTQFRQIPLYVFSISGDEALRQAALQEGANGFFQKPYSFPALKSILREILISQRGNSSGSHART